MIPLIGFAHALAVTLSTLRFTSSVRWGGGGGKEENGAPPTSASSLAHKHLKEEALTVPLVTM